MKTGLILGFFDGVHAGHRAVIESAINSADNTVLLTFKNSPAIYFNKKAEYIMLRNESIAKAKSLGVDKVVETEFSEIASMTAEEYLQSIVTKYSPYSISTGFNHTFGLNKNGNPDFLYDNQNKYNYKYICVNPVVNNGQTISSTRIREELINGNIETANLLLESNFSITGTVSSGQHIGRTIGFPTANIDYPKELVKIPYGVYKTVVSINNIKFQAITNWGIKPTLNNMIEPVFETHILNFDENLYGKKITVEIVKKIRGEYKFNSLDELKAQIAKDIKEC